MFFPAEPVLISGYLTKIKSKNLTLKDRKRVTEKAKTSENQWKEKAKTPENQKKEN